MHLAEVAALPAILLCGFLCYQFLRFLVWAQRGGSRQRGLPVDTAGGRRHGLDGNADCSGDGKLDLAVVNAPSDDRDTIRIVAPLPGWGHGPRVVIWRSIDERRFRDTRRKGCRPAL